MKRIIWLQPNSDGQLEHVDPDLREVEQLERLFRRGFVNTDTFHQKYAELMRRITGEEPF